MVLLALETSCGSRKGEFLDPNIQFLTWSQWKKSPRYTLGLRTSKELRLGTMEIGVDVAEEKADDDFMQYVLQRLNKYLSEESDEFEPDKI